MVSPFDPTDLGASLRRNSARSCARPCSLTALHHPIPHAPLTASSNQLLRPLGGPLDHCHLDFLQRHLRRKRLARRNERLRNAPHALCPSSLSVRVIGAFSSCRLPFGFDLRRRAFGETPRKQELLTTVKPVVERHLLTPYQNIAVEHRMGNGKAVALASAVDDYLAVFHTPCTQALASGKKVATAQLGDHLARREELERLRFAPRIGAAERTSRVTTRASYRRRVRRERFEWPPEDCIPGSPWTGGSLRFGNRLRRTFGCGSTRRLSA